MVDGSAEVQAGRRDASWALGDSGNKPDTDKGQEEME